MLEPFSQENSFFMEHALKQAEKALEGSVVYPFQYISKERDGELTSFASELAAPTDTLKHIAFGYYQYLYQYPLLLPSY